MGEGRAFTSFVEWSGRCEQPAVIKGEEGVGACCRGRRTKRNEAYSECSYQGATALFTPVADSRLLY